MRRVKIAIILLPLLITSAPGLLGQRNAVRSEPRTAGTSLANSRTSQQFSAAELRAFSALGPIDTHTHVYRISPEFQAMLARLNLHLLDILYDDKNDPETADFERERRRAWAVVEAGHGRIALCTTFNPFKFGQPQFSRDAIRKINEDFARGAVAVKIWKNVGMEVRDAGGSYVMPDNAAFQPILKDISAHDKTLIVHLADPNSVWEAPNRAAPDYEYLEQHPALYMYGKPGVPSKAEILRARDTLLAENPHLRVVGAHLGSMESDLGQLARHLDRYPDFAVDLAARMVFLEMQPRAKAIEFITQYQDRLIYGTDNGFYREHPSSIQNWMAQYVNDWCYLATNNTVLYRGKKVQGLNLPVPVLRKIYHLNAVRWFPGIDNPVAKAD